VELRQALPVGVLGRGLDQGFQVGWQGYGHFQSSPERHGWTSETISEKNQQVKLGIAPVRTDFSRFAIPDF
jgi:hypothetical protein